ncbi:hypothetical protein JL720_3896 [Aureococcus anophagefferens]|nr:hypothetical protein JL720_3896 [Aureococcus anophagefferens]
MGVQDFNDWFCIPAFFVLFRETLEVWLGAAVGGAASVAIGVVILSIYYTQKSTMTTTTAFVVEGGMLGFACVVITYFLVTHLAPGMKSSGSWQVKWERNMDELVQAQIDKTNEYGFFTLSFTPESMPIPIVTGIFAGVAFGASMFVGTNKMDLSLFFKFSAGFLALIAAGLGSHASYEFQKGEAFGAWACKRICDDVWVPAAEDWDGAWRSTTRAATRPRATASDAPRLLKDLSGEPTYDEFLAYHGNAKYADDYVRAVMWDRLSDNSTAKLDPRPELFSTNTLSWDMAFQMALKAAQYQSTWMYSLHELYSALGKCEAGDVGPEGAPHAWDEGWAFYVGSIPGETGSPFGSLSYALPDMRCNAWNYCADDAGRPAWREAGDGANSDVNARMLRLYRAGLAAVRDETRCAEARTYVDKILVQMTFPLMQGAMRYAYRADPQGEGTALGTASLGHGKTWAELHAFTMAVLPRVASCAPEAAAVLERNLVLPDVLDASTHDQLVPDGYVAVKEAFQASYACLGITCADVGSLDAIPGLEACDDGSTLDDEVAYYDGLEEIGARPDGDWEEENCDDDEADASWHSYRRLEAEPWYDALVEQSIAWPNEEVWDITGCCDTKNGFFFLMMVLFWYRPAITNLELIIWVIYWPIIAFWGWYKVRDITDFNAELQAAADAKGEEDLKPEAEWARPAPRPARRAGLSPDPRRARAPAAAAAPRSRRRRQHPRLRPCSLRRVGGASAAYP